MAKKQNSQILSPENYIRQRARNLPLFKCLVNDGWEEDGLAHITIARRHINGNITFCAYLVDLKCLGIKDSFYDFNIPEADFDEFVDKLSDNFELSEVDYALAHNIIHAGWEYAEEIGFKPCKTFLSTTMYMLEEDNDDITLINIPCGGEDGKPLFIQGPLEDDAMANQILSQLQKNVGAGNFDYMLQVDDMPSDETVFYREYEENSFEDNRRTFLELSHFLDEVGKDPDMIDGLDEDDEENEENTRKLMVLTGLLYQEIIPDEEMNLWMKLWADESDLYEVSIDAMPEMLGFSEDTTLTPKDIIQLCKASNEGKREKFFQKRFKDLPYQIVMKIREMEDSPAKEKKIATALGRFPDHGLIRIEDRMQRVVEGVLREEELHYEAVFGSREVITPIEYAALQTLRITYFISKKNYAGLESLYYSIEDEFDFQDEDLDEDIVMLLPTLLATRISLLRLYLLQQ